MKNLKKIWIKLLILFLLSIIGLLFFNWTNAQNTYRENSVPDYYYANYKFIDNWNEIWDSYAIIKARYQLWESIPKDVFQKLAKNFEISFPNLPQDSTYKITYEKCIMLANNLAQKDNDSDLSNLLWNSCFATLSNIVNIINESKTVHAVATATPSAWSAPLTVTFDARWSSDPSSETLPVDNFFWYYRTEDNKDVPMWVWQVINYTFKESDKYVVHLVVRSSNVKEKGILDWEKDLIINVSPKAANIVVYANSRKIPENAALKIWTAEAERWVVFDGSTTQPTWWRKIMSHSWSIVNSSNDFTYSKKNIDGSPSFINVPLKWNWQFKITLTTVDNEKNTTSETFLLNVSDPVAIIKQTPLVWNTSSTYTFDASSSYSLTSKLDTYIWEIFDENWNKVVTDQGKKISKVFTVPWSYLVRLTISDMAWNKNIEIKDVFIESSSPVPQFTITPTKRWAKPSEFILNASNSSDVDILAWVDNLSYEWSFWTDNVEIISTQNDNETIVVQFNEIWEQVIKLKVTDLYWKSKTITKKVNVQSVLRPEIQALPNAIQWGKEIKFSSTVNTPVFNYRWDFWDNKWSLDWSDIVNAEYKYSQFWIYTVTLTVVDTKWDTNTVSEQIFIWQQDFPIAAYKVYDSSNFIIHDTDVCDDNWKEYKAFPIDRYAKLKINPSISVNAKWNSQWLSYKREWRPVKWTKQSKTLEWKEFNNSFNLLWCSQVKLQIADSNNWKTDTKSIRFNVKNALPTLKNVTISFPQYTNTNNQTQIWFATSQNINNTTFECNKNDSSSTNLTVKVTAVGANDSDWSISRLRFYYVNTADPERYLDYSDQLISTPFAYFVLPRISWDFRFWVILYDNDWWVVNSEDLIWNWPSVSFSSCEGMDIPSVTLRSSAWSAKVWDTVTFSISSTAWTNIDDFEANRTFYYDFTWDGTRDEITKQSSIKYTFKEPYSDWIIPRAAVEYRWKIWTATWGKILVQNAIKPILLYNTYKNIAIFRDLSMWTLIQRQICFDEAECNNNTNYKRTHIVSDIENLKDSSSTDITENYYFIQKYPDYWNYNVKIFLRDKYDIRVTTWFSLKLLDNSQNGRIASWVNMITIPETSFNNWSPEIFLASNMNNKVVMYINHENWSKCFIDKDISQDWDDHDGKTDNDIDYNCNSLISIEYSPTYETVIWRVYFTNEWKLTYKNFYVTFEWYNPLEVDEAFVQIYQDLTTLINWLSDDSVFNSDLKTSLDVLRKNLKDRHARSARVITIRQQLLEWGNWVSMTQSQKDLLEEILSSLDNEDTISSQEWLSDYEKAKKNILVLISGDLKQEVNDMFSDFESNEETLDPDEKFNKLSAIYNRIWNWVKENVLDKDDMKYMTEVFCELLESYDLSDKSSTCNPTNSDFLIQNSTNSDSKWLPTWLIIVLVVLIWILVLMWCFIWFYAIKSRLNNEDDEE